MVQCEVILPNIVTAVKILGIRTFPLLEGEATSISLCRLRSEAALLCKTILATLGMSSGGEGKKQTGIHFYHSGDGTIRQAHRLLIGSWENYHKNIAEVNVFISCL